MGLIITILLGALVGFLAGKLLGRDEGFFASLIIGVVGAIIGGLLSRLVTGSNQSFLDFNWVNLLWAFIGSVVVVALLNYFQNRPNRIR